jgi:hypothetical protein
MELYLSAVLVCARVLLANTDGREGKAVMQDEKAVMREELDQVLRKELGGLEDRLIERLRRMETNLLTEFHRYASGQQARMHKLEVWGHETDLRLHAIEERLLELERRIRPERPR